MESAHFTDEYGKEVFVLNFSYDDMGDALPLIEECAAQIRQRPENSVLTLTIIGKGRFDTALVERLKELTKGNAPYVKRAAIVGVSGLYKVVISAVSIFSRRDFKLFDDKAEAIEYLQAD